MSHGFRPAPVLAIETSCDDTACAVLAQDGTVLAERVVSQTAHAALGGVVPEIAARAHLDVLPALTRAVLGDAGLNLQHLGAIAASTGPGLIGGLIVGSTFAKGLALARGLPFIAVNHIEAHALTARLPSVAGPGGLSFPYLLLLVSGGHCQCVAVRGVGHYERLGGTIDDAAGEAFDKVAKMLGLGWPGGPAVEALAREGDPEAVDLPRPLYGKPGCDFSFSGLKTAVSRKLEPFGRAALPLRDAADMAASFQACVADIMADRAEHAARLVPDATALVVAGGVAANSAIRQALEGVASSRNWRFLAPPLRLCTDNAVMVAWAAIEHLRARGDAPDDLTVAARPRWPLSESLARTA
ncbi:tRNA (adenosine(37)-N6)-threonylcarbamoyltransferase complex transferase subunit TsaD [Tanticharoenia sakaeratensis]|uniref:tRNA N6-adenosine threonylcarbamoyltransferase n=1 Tax=Tanticharoenia sakaeratensis NBRC 103193 TaxID=1231623 RepID=A0A0D6MJT2_9PROT|nr:tRNA (adenosine(37)-N6)-threonylcarbamoyltransferase complex transferase subunit TsaD [Tanticharoenia sakaeratensis]GAN53919.1 metalloendopeptidase, glycoprotease family protein [Tanticharoenia sakaeratensis NBRC 103193]GBQ25262.1 O-sialoglycoprotein endopeptidase [Tanticharoenia sakaeratensis NBRC 103193]